ncbi:MAG: DNA primase, partial [Deltaproteobacteria bacterium]|nr:DNA primase [Deltaproteobacteria bacterium]
MGTVATARANTLKSVDEIRNEARAKIAQEEAAFSKSAFSFNELLDFAKSGEAGDARLFSSLFQGKLVKDHSSDRWYWFTGHHWEEDRLNEALAKVEDLIPHYVTAARQCSEQELKATQAGNKNVAEQAKETREIFLKKIAHLQRRRYRENVLVLAAAGEGSLGITGSEWDLDPYLLPFKNGVLNLRDRLFRPGRPEDFIKTVCPTEWRGFDAPAPRWEKFLLEILNGDLEVKAYSKRLLGYGISGLTVEHKLPILWGPEGRNGKGTMLETLGYVLGPLAGPVQGELLLQEWRPRSSAAPSPDIMALRGKRLVWASETDQGRKLNAGRVKLITGGDTLTGRNPYDKREVTFAPTHTLLLLTNFRPRVDPIDSALWER